MVGISLKTNGQGDHEAHVSGCAHLSKKSRYQWDDQVHVFDAGDTIVDAIVAADTAMAAWFCCTPYTTKSQEDGCWAFNNGVRVAPCLKKLIAAAKITYDADGRPFARS